MTPTRRWPAVVLGVLALVNGCGVAPRSEPGTLQTPTVSSQRTQGGTPRPIPTPSSTPTCPADVPERLSLRGQHGRAFAFAPLTDAAKITVEGEVEGAEAWSTSKVLVVAAFLATTAGGDPEAVSAANRRRIRDALTRSDADAVRSLRQQIPGRPGQAMTTVLRSIGDTTTTAPDSLEGTMRWTIRQQVRFMVALAAGEVVSARTSVYLRETMRPTEVHGWGLGRIGATVYKGGWLRQGRVTRQMGLLDGYAVAIITDRGPVVRQSDGDSAHVEAMDELARLLAGRLAYERCR